MTLTESCTLNELIAEANSSNDKRGNKQVSTLTRLIPKLLHRAPISLINKALKALKHKNEKQFYSLLRTLAVLKRKSTIAITFNDRDVDQKNLPSAGASQTI